MVSALAGAGGLAVLPELALGATVAANELLVPPGTGMPTGDVHDFDFFVGTWNGHNRRLKKRFAGSTEWEEFPDTLTCGSHLGGVLNLDYEVKFPTKGWSGATVRTFNVKQRQWYIYWVNTTTGALFPPVIGGFKGDHGVFFGDDSDEGRPVKVRFDWTRQAPGKALWQQAFSLDGKTWETNWTCQHTRIST